MTTVIITLGFVALFFILMSVRLIFLKDGEFKGTCASQSPFLNKEGATCGYCGKTVDANSSCGNPENEVDKVMAKFK
jgi:hypothetical protein